MKEGTAFAVPFFGFTDKLLFSGGAVEDAAPYEIEFMVVRSGY